jgi:hypothetical protein
LKQFDFEGIYRTDNYDIRRGLEQMIYDSHYPDLNRIRPVSPINPNRDKYQKAAEEFLKLGNGR